MPAAAQAPWWHDHFADFLLIPAGLPLWLWLERRIGWRRDDGMPRWREIAFALVTWTVAAELIAPRIFPQATGDAWDAVAYAGGAWLPASCGDRHRDDARAPLLRLCSATS